MSGQRPVIVGVSSEPGNDSAVRWAAAEARNRQMPLLLLHVIEEDDLGELLDTARSIALVDLAESRIFGAAVYGVPGLVLTAESANASLVVLGSRPRTPPNWVSLGSVCDGVALAARCPVVVVRPGLPVIDGPVVAGVDGTDLSQTVVPFAFEDASRRGVSLTVVLAWRSHGGASGGEGAQMRAAHTLAGIVGEWQEKHPEVKVRQNPVESSPVSALLAESVGASLLVVGSHGVSSPGGRFFGSVSHAVLQHSPCPVAVVHATDR